MSLADQVNASLEADVAAIPQIAKAASAALNGFAARMAAAVTQALATSGATAATTTAAEQAMEQTIEQSLPTLAAAVATGAVPPATPLVITPGAGALPNGVSGQPYSLQLSASGGSGSGYLFFMQGLPSGLECEPSGAVGGTATQDGAFVITTTVLDGNGDAFSVQHTLEI